MDAQSTTTVTYDEVMTSIEATKRGLQTAAAQVVWQIENRVWTVTGHADWDEFREAYYDGVAVILPTDDRKELVPKLRATGMTQQQIADTLGVTNVTVHRDLKEGELTNVNSLPETVTNSRGEKRPAKYTRKPKPPRTNADGTWTPASRDCTVTRLEKRQEEPEQKDESEGGSACFPDPSDGANQMKDRLRGINQWLAPWYRHPTPKALDVLDKWLERQQKLSQQARKRITP